MNNNCGIIDDLLPLYVDGACSEESKAAIEAHLATCEMCRKKLERMQSDSVVSETSMSVDEITVAKYANKVRKHRIKFSYRRSCNICDCCLSTFIGLPNIKRYAQLRKSNNI